MRDFTMEKYVDLCHALLGAGYESSTVHQYLSDGSRGRIVVLRHDVDRKPENALKMAELENAIEVRSTYYFRYPYTFKPEIIQQISSLGHEVGYHYEVLAKAKGDQKKAIELFGQELEVLRTICDIHTICMHGSPLSRYDNRELWKSNNFRDYGIEGEAYLSMDGKGLRYFTDTGRDWSGRYSVRDVMSSSVAADVETTDELIAWIRSAEKNLYLTAHPERWAMTEREWFAGNVKDRIMNVGKMGISRVMGVSK